MRTRHVSAPPIMADLRLRDPPPRRRISLTMCDGVRTLHAHLGHRYSFCVMCLAPSDVLHNPFDRFLMSAAPSETAAEPAPAAELQPESSPAVSAPAVPAAKPGPPPPGGRKPGPPPPGGAKAPPPSGSSAAAVSCVRDLARQRARCAAHISACFTASIRVWHRYSCVALHPFVFMRCSQRLRPMQAQLTPIWLCRANRARGRRHLTGSPVPPRPRQCQRLLLSRPRCPRPSQQQRLLQRAVVH
jgi:hypothetical protein